MLASPISRRQLLRLGVVAVPLLLGGCGQPSHRLLSCRRNLPEAWMRLLPKDWTPRSEESPQAVLAVLQGPAASRPALAQLWDGWAANLPTGLLQPIDAPQLLNRLIPQAAAISRLFAPPGSPPLAFPWAVDPWVLLLRDRPDLSRRRDEGWDLLLDPSLRGKIVLPSSPRVSISLMREDPERLRRLRRATIAYDDQDGLSLLLGGEAEALVLPRHRAVPLLRSDPRLDVVLPEDGAPLGWNLLVRPAGPAAPMPLEWLERSLQPPLLARLLAAGWLPPLPHAQLEPAVSSLPPRQRALLVPSESQLSRCWSLPPLTGSQRQALQELWDGATPVAV